MNPLELSDSQLDLLIKTYTGDGGLVYQLKRKWRPEEAESLEADLKKLTSLNMIILFHKGKLHAAWHIFEDGIDYLETNGLIDAETIELHRDCYRAFLLRQDALAAGDRSLANGYSQTIKGFSRNLREGTRIAIEFWDELLTLLEKKNSYTVQEPAAH